MDVKRKQIVYHDWESGHYDDKWSISFDQRCVDYATGRFRKAVPDPSAAFGRVLEVGCGTGFFLLNLAQTVAFEEAWCTDISAGMVDTCVANGQRLGVEVHGQVADAESLPFPDDSFDLVIGHAMLHHLPDVAAALAECRRVLRPGGRLVMAGEPTRTGDRIARHFKRLGRAGVRAAVAVAGADRVLAEGVSALPEEERAAAGLEWEVDLHCFVPSELEALASAAGFDQVRTETEELTANWFGWVARTVEAMVGAEHLPRRYPWAVYGVWRRLFAFDEVVARRVVPKGVFYNCVLTATAPTGGMEGAGGAAS